VPPYGLKNTVVALICLQAIICLPRMQKSMRRMLRHRAVYGDNCGVVEYCALLDAIEGCAS